MDSSLQIAVDSNLNEFKGTENFSQNVSWLLYGAYGYTGELIIRQAIERRRIAIQQKTPQLPLPILAGRNATRLNALAQKLKPLLPESEQFVIRSFSLDDPVALDKGLEGVTVVLHCAGPFAYTCKQMVEACIRTKTHYMDISGEIDTTEYIFSKSDEAIAAGIVMIPGVGFDVVPSDCLLALLAQKVSGVTYVESAVKGFDWLSRGSIKSALEFFGVGGKVRVDGVIKTVPFSYNQKEIDFTKERHFVVSAPLLDVSTAFYSTGARNITTYYAISKELASWLNSYTVCFFSYLTSWYYIKASLQTIVDWTVYGPTEEAHNTKQCEFWGRAYNEQTGEECIGTVTVPETYKFTADASLCSIHELLLSQHKVALKGSLTPSSAFGPSFITKIPGVTLHPLKHTRPTKAISPFRRADDEDQLFQETTNWEEEKAKEVNEVQQ